MSMGAGWNLENQAESKKATKKESSSSDDASDEDETVNYLLIKLI